jgi:hypothetical protein
MKVIWERIDSKSTALTTPEERGQMGGLPTRELEVEQMNRAKLPGGWLIYVRDHAGTHGGVGVVFYPDPKHEWDGNSLP